MIGVMVLEFDSRHPRPDRLDGPVITDTANTSLRLASRKQQSKAETDSNSFHGKIPFAAGCLNKNTDATGTVQSE
jgi:hypothetical protein